jgi:hypothetical protein
LANQQNPKAANWTNGWRAVRIRLKGINSITKKLADGTRRTYWYAWKSGLPLRGEPGTPEFVASYNEAVARKVTPPEGVLVNLLQQYQESDNFRSRRDRTRHDYIQQIKRIERDLATFRWRRSPTAAHAACSWSGATSWR